MQITRIEDYIGGWYAGNFTPNCFKTQDFEVGFKTHKKDEVVDTHYHEKVTEINLLVYGKLSIQGKILTAGDIFIIEPYEITNPIFLEDCGISVVKVPGIVNDKKIILNK